MYAISAMAKRSVSITRSPLRLPVRYGMKGPIVALAPMMHAAVAAMIAARNKRASPNARAISKKPSFILGKFEDCDILRYFVAIVKTCKIR